MSNTLQYEKLKNQFKINIDGSIEKPAVFLCDKRLKKIGQIPHINEFSVVTNFNSNNECNFIVYKYCDGNINPLWDDIVDFAVIMVNGLEIRDKKTGVFNKIGFGLFEIKIDIDETDCTVKKVNGVSLQEKELSDSKCTLEINTEDDIGRDDYDEAYPTLFYRTDGHKEASLLHRILTYAPHYTIGHVDDSLKNINREFSCKDTPILDFLHTIGEEIGCVFIFDPYSRTINAFDLTDHCLDCEDNRHIIDGICQKCGGSNIEHGYGKDISLYVDTKNLAEQITLKGDADSVKNCFKLEAGDDEITNLVGQRLIGNSNYIWTFSQDELNRMSKELKDRYLSYTEYVKTFQSEFNTLWDEYNELLKDKTMWQTNKFPKSYSDFSKASEVFDVIKSTIKYTYISNKATALSTLSKMILKYANLIASSEYTVEYAKNANGVSKYNCTYTQDGNYEVISSWSGYLYIYKKNHTDEDGNNLDEYYSPIWNLSVKKGYQNTPNSNNAFSNDYYMYMKQMLDYAMLQSKTTYKVKYDTDYTNNIPDTSDKYYYKNFFKEYSVDQLQSWYDAYQTCNTIIFEQNNIISTNPEDEISKKFYYIIENGSISSKTIYEALKEKYEAFCNEIEIWIKKYEEYIKQDDEQMKLKNDRINEINNLCNIRDYLGEDLYMELISYKKEETYSNQNFTSDVIDDNKKMENVENFILAAKDAISKACQLQYTVTTKMANVLSDMDYVNVYDTFILGNYIRLRVDNKLIRLRLTSLSFDFDNIEQTDVTFSEASILGSDDIYSKIQQTLSQSQSLATSFGYVQKQSTSNDKKLNNFDKLFTEGLDATNTLIKNAENQTTIIDNHGILTRKYLPDMDDYSPYQMRITNSTIGFTTNNWDTIKAAFGEFFWNGEWKFGLIAESLVGREIIGNDLTIMNESGTYEMTDNGFFITSKDGENKIEINAKTPFITFSKGNKIYFHYSPTDGLIIDGKGTFSGRVIVGNEAGAHILLDPVKPSMIINNGEKNLFSFNENNDGILMLDVGLESPEITGGIIKSLNYDESIPQGMIINLGKNDMDKPSMYMYSDASTFFSLDPDNGLQVTKGKIGGWTINERSIWASNDDKTLYLSSKGNIYSYEENSDVNYSAILSKGKWSFGKWINDDFNSDDGYCDISYSGFFAKSAAAIENGLGYTFKVDTINDTVAITNHSENPGLYVKNYGTGDTLYCENTTTGQANKAFHCKVYTGDNKTKYLSVFGEANKNRIVFRADTGDDNGPDSPSDFKPCKDSALGTSGYPWGEIHVEGGVVSTSDLKQKDVIGGINKEKALKFITNLSPIEYTFKTSEHKRIHMGFGAQPVSKLAHELNMGDLALYEATCTVGEESENYYRDDVDDSKLIWGLKYNEFIAPMVASIQALHEMITDKDKIIEEQNKKIDDLSQRLEKIERVIQNQGLS